MLPVKRANDCVQKGWAVWVSLLFVVWTVAWIASETIPIYNEITAVIGALFSRCLSRNTSLFAKDVLRFR